MLAKNKQSLNTEPSDTQENVIIFRQFKRLKGPKSLPKVNI